MYRGPEEAHTEMHKEKFARARGMDGNHSAQTPGKCVVWGIEQTWV